MKESDLIDQRLRQKPQTRIGKDGLADDLKLSRFQLYRRVKAQSGVSPKQLAGKHRIEQACMLLKDTQQSVAAIGNEVGVPDANYFTRFFKLHTGYSPRAWRKAFATNARKTTTVPSLSTPSRTVPHTARPVSAPHHAEDDLPVHLL